MDVQYQKAWRCAITATRRLASTLRTCSLERHPTTPAMPSAKVAGLRTLFVLSLIVMRKDSLATAVLDEEVNRTHGDAGAVNKLHRLVDIPLEMAKARIGDAVRKAIEGKPNKAFGHAGLISSVCSGEKAPEYLARIYQDPDARCRFAQEWLQDTPGVRMRVTFEFDCSDERRSA